ncbi:MAG: hypothetical protein AMXMBFR4_23760 [Candidatus Hydrogenedentota bacterium]
MGGAESVAPVADDFGFVVEPFDGAVVNAQLEVVQDVLFMPPQGPGEVAQGFEPGLGGPPKLFLQEAFGAALVLVLEELTEAFLEQIARISHESLPMTEATGEKCGLAVCRTWHRTNV